MYSRAHQVQIVKDSDVVCHFKFFKGTTYFTLPMLEYVVPYIAWD